LLESDAARVGKVGLGEIELEARFTRASTDMMIDGCCAASFDVARDFPVAICGILKPK